MSCPTPQKISILPPPPKIVSLPPPTPQKSCSTHPPLHQKNKKTPSLVPPRKKLLPYPQKRKLHGTKNIFFNELDLDSDHKFSLNLEKTTLQNKYIFCQKKKLHHELKSLCTDRKRPQKNGMIMVK